MNSGKIQVSEKNLKGPAVVLELLKQHIAYMEERRNELKPQWLREWEDSRRP